MANSEPHRRRARRSDARRRLAGRHAASPPRRADPVAARRRGAGRAGLARPAAAGAGSGGRARHLCRGAAAVQAARPSALPRCRPRSRRWPPTRRPRPRSRAGRPRCASCGWRSAAGRAARGLRLRAREDELDAARAVLAALPEPLLLLDADRRVVRANEAAEALLGEPAASSATWPGALRHPAVLAATDAVLRGDGAADRRIRADQPGRAPSVGADRAAVAADRRRRRRGAGAARPHRAQAQRAAARRFRRQCQPRAAHAARLAGRLHRDPARAGARRRRRARALPRASWPSRPTACRALVDDLLSLSRIEMNEHRPPTGARRSRRRSCAAWPTRSSSAPRRAACGIDARRCPTTCRRSWATPTS